MRPDLLTRTMTHPRLRVAPARLESGSPLFGFGLASPRAGHTGCGLDYLGGDLIEEHWCVDDAVENGRDGDVVFRRSGELLFLAFECRDDSANDPAATVETAYADLLELAPRLGFPHLLRAWNYLPAINDGSGDRERYRRFCVGRARALIANGYRDSQVCAGTAIGGDEPRLRVYLLCGRAPGVNIENPRQVSAYDYPREYGPRAPSFARATALASGGDEALLMISGTASVVGHRSLHAGDVDAQLKEVIRNLEILLSESAARLGTETAHFDGDSLLRVYVRHAEHWPAIERHLRAHWPAVRLAGLRGDICRSDLLVEIEAVSRL